MSRLSLLAANLLLIAFLGAPALGHPDEDCIVVGVDAVTIQEAIDLASGTGRTILVPPGTYSEQLETPGLFGETFTIRSQVPGSKVIIQSLDFNPATKQIVVEGGDTLLKQELPVPACV